MPTDKATLLVLELPEGITEIGNTDKRISIPDRKGGHHFVYGNWQLLGRLPDITEGQWGEIVEDASYKYPYEFKKKYENYNEGDFDFNCSSESGASLLQANEVYFENHLREKPVQSEFYWGFLDDLEKWKEAQSKVWDKERCYLLIKVD